jgi:sestrin 1/3
MSFHPNYLQEYYTFSNYIMYSQGALSLESRHYISIMASARHKCYYLVNQQENEFISIKGNKKWLTSHENLPQKLRDLFELNKLLCHQPWLINRSHIEVNFYIIISKYYYKYN